MSDEKDSTAVDLGPVKKFLHDSLKAHLVGQSQMYQLVLNQLRLKDDSETLLHIMLAMAHYIYIVTSCPDKFRDLFHCLFNFDFLCELRISKAFLELAVHLISANVLYLNPVLDLFARTFRSLHRILANDAVAADKGLVDAIHETFQKICRIVPTAHNVFLPILYSQLPHKRFESHVLNDYIAQLFKLVDYLPVVQHQVVDMVVERCLEIDVDIVIEDSGDVRLQRDDERDDDPFASEEIFAFDSPVPPSSSSLSMPHENLHAVHHSKPRIPMEVAELADKLDTLLSLFISFIDTQLAKQDTEVTRRLQGCLLDVFERRLLSAHKSKFVQFVLFHLASRQTSFCYDMAHRLLHKALSPSEASIIRQSAVMYLASFVSRARFIPMDLVRDLVRQLVFWSVRYLVHHKAHTRSLSSDLLSAIAAYDVFFPQTHSLTRIEDTSRFNIPSHIFVNRVEYDDFGRVVVREHTATQHEVFYAAVQSCCYIVCFFGTELTSRLEKEATWRTSWEVLVSSRFDPLRYTLRTVRQEFLKLAYHLSLLSDTVWEGLSPDLLVLDTDPTAPDDQSVCTPVFVWPHVQLSTFCDLATTTTSATTHGMYARGAAALGPNTLESFFPFDPCLLVKVHAVIEAAYRPWRGVPGLPDTHRVPILCRERGKRGGDSDDDDDNDDDDDEADSDEDEDSDEEADSDEDVAMAQSLVSSLACTEEVDAGASSSMASMSISMGTSMSVSMHMSSPLAAMSTAAASSTGSGGGVGGGGGKFSVHAGFPPTGKNALAALPNLHASQLSSQLSGYLAGHGVLGIAKAGEGGELSGTGKDATEDSEHEGERDGLEHIPNPDLTLHSLRQQSGHAQQGSVHKPPNYRRPRLYSIGSNGSW